jgi:hypothetical protein
MPSRRGGAIDNRRGNAKHLECGHHEVHIGLLRVAGRSRLTLRSSCKSVFLHRLPSTCRKKNPLYTVPPTVRCTCPLYIVPTHCTLYRPLYAVPAHCTLYPRTVPPTVPTHCTHALYRQLYTVPPAVHCPLYTFQLYTVVTISDVPTVHCTVHGTYPLERGACNKRR